MVGIDEQRLLSAAAAQLKVDEVLEDTFRPAFGALIRALRDDAGLSQVGSWQASARLMKALEQRVALRAFEAKTPKLEQVELDAPIFITGLPRAGTHLLHNLLARNPGLWAPRLWELQRPVPPRRIDERWIDGQIHATATALDQLFEAAPDLRRLHPLVPTSPEACAWLLGNSFSTLSHALRWHVPSYVEHILGADMGPAYADHRRFARVLAYRHRHEARAQARMVLEDPWHLWHLDSLLDAYPDAWVVRVTVEPEQALEAMARICFGMHRIDGKRPLSAAKTRAYCGRLLDAGLAAGRRGSPRLPSWRVIEVPYASLCEDPIAAVRRLGAYLRVPSSEAALHEATRWLSDTRGMQPLAPGASSASMRLAACLP